jgi:hypothetical protein
MLETKNITATFVRDVEGFAGTARLWKLSEPVSYEEGKTTDRVITSATSVMFTGAETYIFPANAGGVVIDWLEMPGSFRGALNHEAAITRAGWEIA